MIRNFPSGSRQLRVCERRPRKVRLKRARRVYARLRILKYR